MHGILSSCAGCNVRGVLAGMYSTAVASSHVSSSGTDSTPAFSHSLISIWASQLGRRISVLQSISILMILSFEALLVWGTSQAFVRE